MGTTSFNFSEPGMFPLPAMRASGPDDDVKTLVTPEDDASTEEVSADATPDDGSGPDDDTKTQ